MGMFDWVAFECTCDNCKGKISKFQTKTGDNVLDVLSPRKAEYFYGWCNNCGCETEFDIEHSGKTTIKYSGKFTKTTTGKNGKVLKKRTVRIRKKT